MAFLSGQAIVKKEGTVAMFEHGDGGKGRKVQLVLLDDFYRSNHEQGKLKRLWCTRFS